jgi:hypothetical protein
MQSEEFLSTLPGTSMPFEILYVAFMLLGSGAGLESTEVASLAGFRIDLAGIEPVFARSQLSDHVVFSRAQSVFPKAHLLMR